MLRRMMVLCGVLVVLLVLPPGPAQAGRLGGAYRGPYQDNTVEKNTQSEDVTASGKAEAPTKSEGSKGGSGEQNVDPGSSEDPPEGEDPPDTGEPAPGAETGEGGGGAAAKEPTKTPGSGPSMGPGESGGRTSKTAPEDVLAYWPFWFEHNKEWVLERVFKERSDRTKVSRYSSPWAFMRSSGRGAVTPVTDDQKMKVIFPLLTQCATDKSSWVRDAAVIALGKLGVPEVIPLLVARLDDADPDVAEDACLALGLTRDKNALKPLIAALDHAAKRPYAALGLGLLGRSEALPALLQAYRTAIPQAAGDPSAACIAIGIGAIGDQSAVNELAAPLRRQHCDSRLLVCTVQALGRLGGETALDWLRKTLSMSKDKDVRAAAVLALSYFPDKTVLQTLLGKDGLRASDKMTKLYSLVSLGEVASNFMPEDPIRQKVEAEIQKVTEEVRRDKYTAMFGALASGILGADGSRKLFYDSLLTENRNMFSEESHTAMVMAAGLLEQREVITELREIVSRTGSPEYRGYAAFALGLIGDRQSVDTIRAEMTGRQKEQFLRSCCWAIGMLGDKSDIDLLISMMKLSGATNHTVRGAAAIAVGLIGDGATVDPLRKMVQTDPSSENRAFGIAALGCLIDKSPVPRIPQLFANTHYRVEVREIREVLTNL
jgi:HEAT repeat protein